MTDAEATRILKSREIEINENNVGEDADQLLLREADALRHALQAIEDRAALMSMDGLVLDAVDAARRHMRGEP